MNYREHIKAVEAKCRELLAQFPQCESSCGWKSTIAAIDAISELEFHTHGWDDDCGAYSIADRLIDAIIAAWPEDML